MFVTCPLLRRDLFDIFHLVNLVQLSMHASRHCCTLLRHNVGTHLHGVVGHRERRCDLQPVLGRICAVAALAYM